MQPKLFWGILWLLFCSDGCLAALPMCSQAFIAVDTLQLKMHANGEYVRTSQLLQTIVRDLLAM